MKLDAIHILLYVAAFAGPVGLALLHARYPQWDQAIALALSAALAVAINTHKPGAAQLLQSLQSDAKKANGDPQ